MSAVAAIILAAGSGIRAGGGGKSAPKPYRLVGGIPVLQRTLSLFAGHKAIDHIITVIRADDSSRYDQVAQLHHSRLMPPVIGGATRQQSVLAGLEALQESQPEKVLIHDAARPFVTHETVNNVLNALDVHLAALPALPVTDTLKSEDGTGRLKTLERRGLWAAQTPQGFHFNAILAAHKAARAEDRDDFTDDAAMAEWRDMAIGLVEGDVRNVKLTTNNDFELADRLYGVNEVRVGQGFDVHAFAPGDHVFLCGVKIPHTQSLSGHSDADAGLHALTDALLGAIGDGDIGTHFPPSDPQWRGASSDIFLRDAARRVKAGNASIVNVDVTIICEAPKIGPHREAMQAVMAAILEIELGRVSVKATTTEGLGFTGRGEGIAAQATAAIRIG